MESSSSVFPEHHDDPTLPLQSTMTPTPPMLIHVSAGHLALSIVPLVAVAVVSHHFQFQLETPIAVGTVRSIIQLSILGCILQWLFAQYEHALYVILYILFMILLASWEAVNRSKYHFDGIWWYVLASFLVTITAVALFCLGIVLQPTPLWNPQYAIPIIGMILGNVITGTSLALNTLTSSMVEQALELEVLLSLGATPSEASRRLVSDAVRTSTTPMLNSMAVIGLISIPGMMTGQILGGSPVMEAAKYQMMIIYFIAVTVFGIIMGQVWIVQRVTFDPQTHMWRAPSVFYKKRSLWQHLCGGQNNKSTPPAQASNRIKPDQRDEENHALLQQQTYYSTISNSPEDELQVTRLVTPQSSSNTRILLSAHQLTKTLTYTNTDILAHASVSSASSTPPETNGKHNGNHGHSANGHSSSNDGDEHDENGDEELPTTRILFSNISFQITAGSLTVIRGPSGCGKSTLLKILAQLIPSDQGHVDGDSSFSSRPEIWRHHVRYCTQSKISIPGTPLDLVNQVTQFHSWNSSTRKRESTSDLPELVSQYCTKFGLDAPQCLSHEWSRLSGGEAQRVYLALCLATRPRVLLMDESTSALDHEAKLQVEDVIRQALMRGDMAIVWITHDPDQVERLSKPL